MGKNEAEELSKAEIVRLDNIRILMNDAFDKVKELLDDAYAFQRTLGPSGIKLFKEIKKKEKKDSILHRFSATTLAEYSGRVKAERLAVLLGKCLQQPRPRGALAELKREFPKWRTMLKDFEKRAD